VDDEDFVTPWEASIDAVDLAHEVGTGDMRSNYTLVECVKNPLKHKVKFHSRVDLYVGAEEDSDMVHWTHSVGVPHQQAYVLCPQPHFSAHFISPGPALDRMDETDAFSLLAAQAATGGMNIELPCEGPTDAVINNRDAARDLDDISPVSSVSSPAQSTSSEPELVGPDDWYATLVFTIEGGPGTLWLNWNDYMDMHQKVARALRVGPEDLFNLHIVETPPQDVDRAHTGVVIANRRGDLQTGSTECFVLLDVEFHSAVLLAMPEVVRRAQLIPDVISREQLLRGLGLHPFCRKAENRCLIWVNDELISFGTLRVHLRDGDYVRIAIPPGGPSIDHIDTRCLATAFHQGMSTEDISMRHTLYRLGWHDDLIGPPHVPRNRGFHGQHDDDGVLFLQIHKIQVPALEAPAFLYAEEPKERLPEEPPYRCGSPDPIQTAAPGTFQGIEAEPAVIQELYMHWLAHLAGQEAVQGGDDPILHVDSWYLDMPRFLHCDQHRPVALQQNFAVWFQAFADAWIDVLDPMWPIDLHVVRPTPPATATQRTRRLQVIVVQRLPHDGVANLFTIIRTGPNEQPVRHTARFAPRQVTKPQVIGFAGVANDCYPELSSLQCMVWHGDFQIAGQIALRNRNGVGFVIIIERLPHLHPEAHDHWGSSVWEEDEEGSLLQISSLKQTIYLDDLIPATTAVRLLDCTDNKCLPNPLEVPLPGTADQVRIELTAWGHQCRVFPCYERNVMLCIDSECEEPTDMIHYFFCHDDIHDQDGCFLHSAKSELQQGELMTFLCSLGYARAVILDVLWLCPNWFKVNFHHSEPQLAPSQPPVRTRTPWLSTFGHQRTQHRLVECTDREPLQANCSLTTAFDAKDLHTLFSSGIDMLCTDFSPIDLTPELQEQLARWPIRPLQQTQDLDAYDRLLIFTDGSSMPSMRRMVPERADDLGHPDTWAMIVIGEVFDQQAPTGTNLTILGWTAHPVRWDPDGSAFTGISRIGSDMAERDGLIGAAMWRLSCNHAIPTVVCTDSMLSAGQASGETGTAHLDQSFCLMRALYQALDLALPNGDFLVHHVRAHAGELFNEIVDVAAKQEALRSFNLPRQRLDMRVWRDKLLQIWTLFGQKCGLPSWQDGGFDVSAPNLPQSNNEHISEDAATEHAGFGHDIVDFTCSFASANVQSLYRGPCGHAGKLRFLQQQMRYFQLNFLAVQEARSEQALTSHDKILRISTGHCNGQYGIELWVDLLRPFCLLGSAHKPCVFRKEHFVVVHCDPQRLLVHCLAEQLDLWIFCGHAPHGGHVAQDRHDWWQTTQNILDQHVTNRHLILLLDANAAPGERDDIVVFSDGFQTSVNTPDFRELLTA